MSQIAGYDYDIFISYSHADNTPLLGKPGWVESFHQGLEDWLVKLRGFRALTLWRDDRLLGNTAFDDAIENRIKSSALFLVLNSRNYVQSEYCRKELDIFHRYHSGRPGGLFFGEESRILNILLNNIPHADWLPQLAGTSGFPMHSSQEEGKWGDFTFPSDDKFNKQLGKIVDAIESVLKKSPAPQSAHPQSEKTLPRIFLAETEDGLRRQRRRLQDDLKAQGAEVLVGIPPPDDYSGHRTQVLSVLDKADLSVHLLGPWSGREIHDKEETTYPREQVEIALSCKTPQTIWVPAELNIETIEDEAYRNLIQVLENGSREEKNFAFLRGPPSALTEFLIQKLHEWHSPKAAPNAMRSVLIDTHQKDQGHAYHLAEVLAHQGLDVDFNKDSRDPLQSLANFERTLREVEHLILMFGKVAPEWLEGRVRKALKVVAEQYSSDTPLALENIWVLLLPGSGGKLPLGKLPPIIRIDVLDNSQSEAIEPTVVSKLLQAQGIDMRI
jgi:hypothetical protein